MDIDLARQQWQTGERRVATNPPLGAQVDLVVAELRKRVGQTFTLSELVDAYERADDWARDAIDLADPGAPPPLEASTVTDAAFHRYARGATDYSP
ncbi:MAG TPA: hypothetical protein VFW85_06705 [Gaiellaceae bacterium]|nr:hypothetical protein [Gaiellaceae bacterium]